jgi:hypothetical protein
MRNILFAFAVVLVAVSAQAQKIVNDANAEKRTVSGFHAVEVGGGIDLFLSQGEEGVAVSASETQYRDRIRTEVVNGVLKIKYEPENKLRIGWNSDKRKLKAYVSVKTLDKLSAGGGCDVVVDGTIKAGSLDIHMSGGSDFTGKVDVTDLIANANGGSDMDISGTAKKATIDASGGSDVSAFGLNVETCKAEASGGSDIEITASKEIIAEASGGSDVHYKGNAVVTSIKSGGGGSVKKVSK